MVHYGRVVELADTRDLKSLAFRRESSNLSLPTNLKNEEHTMRKEPNPGPGYQPKPDIPPNLPQRHPPVKNTQNQTEPPSLESLVMANQTSILALFAFVETLKTQIINLQTQINIINNTKNRY